jgi:hypothetical protein
VPVVSAADPQPRIARIAAEGLRPGVYLSSRAVVAAAGPPRTGTPAFLGVRGIDRVLCVESRDAAVETLRHVTGSAAHAVRGFFVNGGHCCYLVPAAGATPSDPAGLGLAALDDAGDFDLVCAPGLASLPADRIAHAHALILAWCARDGRRFAILDAPRNASDLAGYRQALSRALRGQPSGVSSFGAGYYPWLRVADARHRSGSAEQPAGRGGAHLVSVPPSGHVAGIYGRCDRDKGVWAAPANEAVTGPAALDDGGTDPATQWAAASAAGLNTMRSFRKRGIRVWGARTLCDDPALRYVAARRTLQAVARRLRQVLVPIVFEPNTPLLWARINRIVSAQLDDLHRSGALAGATAEQAYFVRCDAGTNPPQARTQGQVVAEAGIAVVAPAEFIVIDILMGEGDLAIRLQPRG